MNGLYALKPWYAKRLAAPRRSLIKHNVSPDALTAAGVACAAGAAAALVWLPAPWAALAVAPLLAGRLAFANLDGALARETGRTSRWGSVLNELGDRTADLIVIAAFAALAPLWLVLLAAAAATLPSWVSLAGAAAGTARINGGPVGKTERCLLVIVAAATGWAVPVLWAIAAGSVATALLRLAKLHKLTTTGPVPDGTGPETLGDSVRGTESARPVPGSSQTDSKRTATPVVPALRLVHSTHTAIASASAAPILRLVPTTYRATGQPTPAAPFLRLLRTATRAAAASAITLTTPQERAA